ncbi:DUF943 family protein [Rosenbergiella sp. S61]|uniref:DUF943 family protein n=1 Tax=Rosenbergiella gaditana TaxID=2726987 RepID=A0ABS5SZN8_9GAMM|nr:DUF943 family protein [Rosenbergiella gaditana]MBT0725526.1 DUF943 family protein [Rosenbergiella gaditana]
MRVKNKKTIVLLVVTSCVLLAYWLWLSLRPVEIIAVHQRNNYSDVLVRSFPPTDKGKIKWWLENKNMLKEKYGIPKPDSGYDGFFGVIFWYFGDGYKETDGYDNLCFSDMKPPINCIEKDKAFTVWNDRSKHILFGVNDGFYRTKENGEMVKIKDE